MKIDEIRDISREILQESQKRLVGYDNYITNILRCLYANGHVLLEGNPGIAKTLAASTVLLTRKNLDTRRCQAFQRKLGWNGNLPH